MARFRTILDIATGEESVVPYSPEEEAAADAQLEEENSRPSAPKIPTTIATAKLMITDGLVEGFAVDSAISGGFQIDTGKFLMFLSSPFDDANYIVNAFDGGLFRCYVQTDDYYTDSFVVTTTDLSGNPADPNCISIIVMKAI